MKLIKFRKFRGNTVDPHPPGPNVHEAHMSGAFIVFGGWVKIIDKTVPSGTLGHEIYCAFGGVGVGGMSSDGQVVLDDKVTWSDFYKRVKSFAYIAASDITGLVFFDGNSKRLGVCVPYSSFDLGAAGGSVKIKK